MKQMKRILAFMLFLALVAGPLSGLSVQAKSKGYKFTYKKVTVYMGGPAKKLIKKAGKPKSVKVAKSCAYKGKDRTYKYKNFILYTYSKTDNGPEYVSGITFLTKQVSTKEGIKIGSSYSKVIKKYGKKKDYLGVYTFKKGSAKLQFEVTDNVVTNIRYVKA
ncbi:MAG: hypothetical protein J1F22_06305 [Lachnospiraceae bacterium]|nr:hypothetical protein [Lachnospiraceae bacterium]